MTTLTLDWQEDEDGCYADTPYGKAIVTKIHSSADNRWLINISRFASRIEQPDGNIINIPRFLDNLEEAKWLLMERLQELARRDDEPKELTNALATLAICRQLLHESDNAQHHETLDLIERIIRKYYGV
jgi:hypothetical protein